MLPPIPQPILMLDLSRQFAGLRSEILAAIEQVCDSQQLILGPHVASFEAAAAAAAAVPHGIGCASGTDALWLAMAAAGIGPGDAVLTSPFSFFATVSAILRCGAHPVLADIDPLTFNLSPAAAERAIQNHAGQATRLRAIMPVHLYGQCADMDAFRDLKARHDLLLFEDAAQAFGASWQRRPQPEHSATPPPSASTPPKTSAPWETPVSSPPPPPKSTSAAACSAHTACAAATSTTR